MTRRGIGVREEAGGWRTRDNIPRSEVMQQGLFKTATLTNHKKTSCQQNQSQIFHTNIWVSRVFVTQINSIFDEILSADFQHAQAFNDALQKGTAPFFNAFTLFAYWIDTPLGPMLSVADDNAVLMLEFFDRRALLKEIETLRKRGKATIGFKKTALHYQLEEELKEYFAGQRKDFSVPLEQRGTPFQNLAWQALQQIPYGQTRSYQEQALFIGHPLAHRAVANANGCNQIAILKPCHRIVKSDGTIGGYGGRVSRKRFLLDLEKQYR